MSARTSSHAKPAEARPARSAAGRASKPEASKRKATARRHPRLSRLLAWLLSAVLGSAGLAYAQVPTYTLPSGGQVVVGSAQLLQSQNLLIINQATARLGMDWQSFSIGSGATVEFRQPGADSVALNRVIGHSSSEIYGQLRANGQVFLVNPHGVLFAPGSKVDVGGLVASSLDLSQADFAAGRYQFNGSGGTGSVVNQGSLRASSGGYLALFGQQVDNQGDITVDGGSVVLASGRAATVSISGNGLLSAVVTGGEAGSVNNSGLIQADGGLVRLDARSAEGLASSLVNNSGIVRANAMVERNGEVWITGDQVSHSGSITADATGTQDAGRVTVKGGMSSGRLDLAGSISAQSAAGSGGQVETSAAFVAIAPSARVNTLSGIGQHGTWTIDPTDFRVSSGSGALTTSGIGAGTLATNLNSGNVALVTAAGGNEPGDIHVDAAVSWSASTTLTLTADRDVNVNQSITATGTTAGLVVTPGASGRFNMASGAAVTLSGGSSSLTIANVGYTLVRDYAGLQALDTANALAGNFALAVDIDASASAAQDGGLGFNPIGNEASITISAANSFSGRFQGLGHSITGLVVNRPASNATGLFASTNGARIDNLVLSGGSVSGSQLAGALVGYASGATQITNVASANTVTAFDDNSSGIYAGGLVGYMAGSASASINRSSVSGNVTSDTNTALAHIGGLVGNLTLGSLSQVSTSGNVTSTLRSGTGNSTHYTGGLAGSFAGTTITQGTASGAVTGGSETGGLVGRFTPGAGGGMSASSASGNVTGTGHAGGLVGNAGGTGSISDSDATGAVTSSATGAYDVGGAVGLYAMSAAPSDLTARGNVSGGNTAGGVIGQYQTNAALSSTSLVSVAPASGTKTVNGFNWAGGLIGYSTSTASISGLSATTDVSTSSTTGIAGGLMGRSNGAVSNSSAAGSVTGASDVGGLIGRAEGAGGLTDVSSTASVLSNGPGSGRVGGLVGYYANTGTLLRGTASGAVNNTTPSGVTGGLVGTLASAGGIQDSSTATTSTVTGNGYAGGLVGDASGAGSIVDSIARGAVTSSSTSAYVGGLVGDFTMAGGLNNVDALGNVSGGARTGGLVGNYGSAGTITDAHSTATTVTGTTYLGGLIGYHNGGAITTASAVATVSSTNTTGGVNAGGLIGRSGGAVSSATASGAVSSLSTSGAAVGGLIGSAEGTGAITDGTASGSVTSASTTTAYVGGLVGYISSGSVVRGTATGNVDGGLYTGGLIGYLSANNASITDASATGSVSGRGDVGGIVGFATGTGGALTSSTATGNVSSSATTGYSAGGAAGYFNLTGGMSSVAVSGTVSGAYYGGGVVGYYDPVTAMSGITSTAASVTAAGYAGGIVGYSDATSTTGLSSAASVTTTGTGGAAGGLAGRTGGAVSGSSASGTVTAAGDAGGLIGFAQGTGALSNLNATGPVSSTSTSAYVGGLIGLASSGSISNSTASGAVSGGNNTGGLVGYHSAAGDITDSSASGSVSVTANSYVGGLVGRASSTGSYTNVSAIGHVTSTHASSYTGGLVGYFNKSGGMSGASAQGNVSGGDRVGGLVGYYVGGNLSSATASGTVTGTSYVGGLVGDFVNSGTLTNSSATGNVTGTTYVGGLVGSYYQSGAATTLQAGGTVTASNTAGGLFGLWQYSALLSDSLATGVVRAGSRAGGLVGYGYSNTGIDNASASGSVFGSTYVGGLVGDLGQTSVTRATASGNVTAVGENTMYVGGLIGYLTQATAGSLTSSTASGTVFADGLYAYTGGLIGQANGGSISQSSASGKVTGRDSTNNDSYYQYTGGLIGYTSSTTISDVSATGDVEGRYWAGGLIGFYSHSANITNASATGDVTGRFYVGGLVGELDDGGITTGTATGNVTSTVASNSTSYTGGLVGLAYLRRAGGISDSSASGNVDGSYYVGGLVGFVQDYYNGTGGQPTIANSRASGSVTSDRTAGGLVGYFYNAYASANLRGIRSSSATGAVQGATEVGGLVGQYLGYGGIEDSWASGDVTGTGSTSTQYLGGLVGTAYNYSSTAGTGRLLRSYASGSVALANNATLGSTTVVYGGGLVGLLDGASNTVVGVADSYATGGVNLTNTNGRMRAGGLVGRANTSIERAYSTGAPVATGSSTNRAIGGLVAERTNTSVTATNSFWATDTSGVGTSVVGTAATLAGLQSAATFTAASWDISASGGSSATWRIYEGQRTPLLRSLLTPLTISLANVTKVYDGTTSLGSAAISINGSAVTQPDRILVAGASANAGTHALTASNLYSTQTGYDLTLSGTATLTIDRRPLSIDGLIADKVYDATTAATVAANPALVGLVAGENLVFQPGIGFSAAFDTKAVGTNKTVTLSGSYTLGDGANGLASNYVLPTAGTTTADITPATLTAGSFAATNRAYDGTTQVAVQATTTTLTGVLGNDAVSVDLSGISTGTMADRHVGTGKAVTVNGASLTGSDAGNYVLAGIGAVTVDITPRTLTINGITATDREYNRGLNVSLVTSGATLSGLVSGDQVTPKLNSVQGRIADKNVGNAKPVTITGQQLRGLDAANYTPVAGATSVNITPYQLTVYLAHSNSSSRVYDGTTNAATYWPTYWYSGDDITVNATSIGFADKNVAYNGSGQVVSKVITATGLTLSGNDASNYILQNSTATLNGTITPKPLAVSGVAAVDRVYNGTRDVDVTISGATVDTTAVVPGDTVSVATPGSGTVVGQMADKNIGTNKAVTVPGLALTGTDAGNYSITSGTGGGVVVDITRKPVTAVYTAQNKVYDGNGYAGISVSSPDIVTGDSINFYIDQSYCGTTCFYARFTEAGFTGNNQYTESRHAGTAKPVVVLYNDIVGADANNYTLLNSTGSAGVAEVTPRPVTLNFNGVSKVYDGTTTASVTLAYNNSTGPYSVDASGLSTSQTAVYTGTGAKNVGTSKPISVSGITLSGAFAGNYVVANTTDTATGTVTAKPITLSGIAATNRPYDGTTTVAVAASGTVGSTGFVSGDTVSVALPPGGLSTGTIANKNVGTDKPVTVTGLSLAGTDAPNYTIDATASGILVDITAAALVPTYAGGTQVYNGGITASVTPTTTGIVSGDTVTFTQTAVFTGVDARNVGSNKPIAVSNIAIGGSGAANYTLASTTASATGDITPKPVTATYTGSSRVYSGVGDVSAAVVGSSLQFIAGDSVGLAQTAVFADGNAGTNKPVNISNITLTGTHAANYLLSNTAASTSATITPRPLGVTGITATNREYDGTTTVAVNVANAAVDTSAVISGDQVSVVLPPSGISAGTMADRNVGNAKPVSITGLSITGTSAANYSLIGATALTVSISPRALTASYAGGSKVYDGSADAPVSASSVDILPIDATTLGFNVQAVFSGGKNVGTSLPIAVSGTFLTGASRDNYALANPNGSATGDITPRTLTATFNGINKVYDGTTVATVSGVLTNFVTGDQIGTTQTAVFTGDKNVGNNKPIAVSAVALSGADAGNYVLGSSSGTADANITPRPISVSGLSSLTAIDRTYDGTRTVAINVPAGITLTPNSADIISGDQVTIGVPPSGVTTGTMANKNAGNNKAVTVDGLTLSGADAANYSIFGTSGVSVNITPLAITASYAGVNRVYNGSLVATATGSASGILAGDVLLINGTGVFTDSKNVGTAKPISITSAQLSGADDDNYTLLNTTGSTTADVTPMTVTPTFAGGSRVYDGLTAAPISATTVFVAGDSVVLGGTGTFTGAGARNVGSNKPVSITGIALTGTDAANYQLGATTATTTASITPRPLTLTGLTGVVANDRAYDGTTTVAVTVNSTGTVALDRSNIIGGDDVDVAQLTGNLTSGTVPDKNVGTNKPVAVTGLALTGADASNYTVAATAGVTVDITPKSLTATFVGQNKVYDGTAAATVIGSSADIVTGDVVTIGGTGVFAAGKNVGTGLTINVTTGLLGGADALNYLLTNTAATTTANITPLTVAATYTGGTRVYDGNTAAPVLGTITGLIAGDTVSLTETAVFTGAGAKNAGINKPVSISGVALQGGDAGNYLLGGSTSATTASITPKPLGVIGLTGVSAVDRSYDGTNVVAVNVGTTGTVTVNPADIVGTDSVSITAPSSGATTGTMLDKNVGSAKPVAVAGLTLTGADAGNYSVATTSGVTVNITPRNLTASFAGQNKVYDGTDAATVLGSSTDVLGGDTVLIGASGVFAAGKNAGSGLLVTFSTAALTGADALNYLLVNPAGSTTADITPRTLTASYTGGTKVYDGTNAAPVTRTVAGLIAGDTVSFSETATFSGTLGKDVGSNKPVAVSGIGLAGADAGNYQLASATAATTASVTPRPLNVTGLSGITAADRVYDGTTVVQLNITGSGGSVGGDTIAGDDVVVNLPGSGIGSSGQMVDKHVGQNKPVALSGLFLSGADSHNYTITGTAGVTVNILPRDVTVAGLSAVDRLYDGTTQVLINTVGGSLSGALPGDDLQLLTSGATASMTTKDAGQGKAVDIAGLTMGGSDARNYRVVSGSGGITVNIAPRPLASTLAVADKVYDGSTAASVSFSDDRVSGDDLTMAATSATFADRNSGTGIAATATGLTLAGADAGNYVLTAASLSGSASITRRDLFVTANALTKVYGEGVVFTGSEFSVRAGDLVQGETLGTLALASAGSDATAPVTGSPYAITAGQPSGGSFNPANYNLSIAGSTLTVQPRPVTVATRSVVRFADEANPTTWDFSTSVGGLLGGDRLQSVIQLTPTGSDSAPGGSVFDLLPSGATWASGNPANYALSYSPGLLVVLPRPPRPGDTDGNSSGGAGDLFGISDEDAIRLRPLADTEFGRAAAAARTGTGASAGAPLPAGAPAPVALLAPDELAALLAGDGRRITLPALQKLPLISLDPLLRRLMNGGSNPATP
jgi:filamentous hemagglutinin family protein